MASGNVRTPGDVRRDLETMREELAGATENLRHSFGEATDITGKLKSNLPAATVAAFALGFIFAGGVGATAELIFRKGREGDLKAALGRYGLVERD